MKQMEDIFEQIYKDCFSRIYAFLFRMTRDGDLTEELTQETFYQAFLSFDKFEGKCDIFTWLAAIAKHTYYKYLRKKKLGFDALDITELEEYGFKDDSIISPQDAVQNKVLKENIVGFVKNLPDKYRDVVLLRIYADMSFSQISAVMRISENSAKVIFFRAKKSYRRI